MAAGQKMCAAGAALAVSLVGSPKGAEASPDSTLVVHVEDHARLPEEDLQTVKREVDDIFRSAGIIMSWARPLHRPVGDLPCDGRRHLAVAFINILTPLHGTAAADTADVLGRAAPAVARAWVFVNRVNEAARNRPVDVNLVLARVLAHEIGHILLQTMTHGDIGIMRPSLQLSHLGLFRFTTNEAKVIRSNLVRTHARDLPGKCR
jgi:hypothetical protein